MSTSVTQQSVKSWAGVRLPAVWVAIAFVAMTATFFYPEMRELVERWRTSIGDSHGMLIAPLVVWLVWLQRDRLEAGRGHEGLAVVGLLSSAALLAFAHAASVDVVVYSLIPVILLFALWCAMGWPAARVLALPVLFFLFALPAWAYMTPVLQWLTVKAVGVLIAIAGVEAFIQGEFVTVPAGTFEIAHGCAGTSFMVVGLAIGALMVILERLPWRAAALVMAWAVGLAAVSNWLRVAIIIYAGNVTDMQSSLVADHYTFGWWVFAFAMLPFFWIARRIARACPELPARAVPPGKVALGPRVWLAVAGLALAPLWTFAMSTRDVGPEPELLTPVIPGWEGPKAPGGEWEPKLSNPARARHVAYATGGDEVDVYSAFYGHQRAGGKLVGYGVRIAGDAELWQQQGTRVVEVGESGARALEHRVLGRDGRERLVWSWYEVRGQRLLSPLEVKLREGLSAFGARPRSGIVALSAACVPDCDAAAARLRALYAAAGGRLAAGTATGD